MIYCKFFNGDCCDLNDLASGQVGINGCRFNGEDSADNDCDSFIETENDDTDDEIYREDDIWSRDTDFDDEDD